MVDWMIEVSSVYRCSANMFFQAIRVMDRYFKLHSGPLKPQHMHLIGLASMLVASKCFDTSEIDLDTMTKHIAHSRLTKEQIAQMEAQVISTVRDKLVYPTSWEVLSFIAGQLNIRGVILRTAEVCLVLWSFMVQHLNMRPGILAAAGLIIAARSLGQAEVVASIVKFMQMPERALMEVARVLHADLLMYPRHFTFFTSAMTFLNFDFKMKENGPLFAFQDSSLDSEQTALLSLN
jgi:hypothetical protein